ncbi:DNA helicase [Rhodoferax sp. GW822-FHT02A01]|uniref:DNA helicase n=1 Tax=Rhodoferax sp. GW822-FHT02A01 TaxID=3141537 RepID=UPI00315CB96B
MKLSAPVYRLKRLAKELSKEKNIPLHAALDRVAQEEGFASWSLLAAQLATERPTDKLLSRLEPGDLVLLGARPGQGKTLLGLDLAIAAAKSGRSGWFFTLEWTAADLLGGMQTLGEAPTAIPERFRFDNADAICASYIMEQLSSAESGTVAVIDYLQILDQRRENPPLAEQVQALKEFARERGMVMVFLSQIDRSFDGAKQTVPSLADVRLPNPLELGLFDKTCFLHKGAVHVG